MSNSSVTENSNALTMRDLAYTGVIGGTAIFGLSANGFAMFLLLSGGKISHAFQQLCFSHCVANSINLCLFLFYCCTVILLQTDYSHTSVVGKLIGGFMVALWDVSVYSHLMTSVNRLIVVFWPIRSRAWLCQRNSTIMICIVWFFGFLHFLPYMYVSQCYIVFYSDIYLWAFSANYCGYVLGKFLDFASGISIFGIIIIFDVCILMRIIKMRGATGKSVRGQDVKFFVQACIQFLLFVVKLCVFYFVSAFYTNDLVGNHAEVFFTTSFVWEACHCMDGMVLIPFHIGDYLKKKTGVLSVAPLSVMPTSQRASFVTVGPSPIR